MIVGARGKHPQSFNWKFSGNKLFWAIMQKIWKSIYIILERHLMNTVILVAIAVIGGIAVTLQGQFMGLMEQSIGSRESVFITYVGGGLVVILISIVRGINFDDWQKVPWYAFTAGLFGLIIVGSIGYVVPRLGVSGGFTLIVASQFVLAALIDHFGWFGALERPIDLQRALGLALMMFGVWLTVR